MRIQNIGGITCSMPLGEMYPTRRTKMMCYER